MRSETVNQLVRGIKSLQRMLSIYWPLCVSLSLLGLIVLDLFSEGQELYTVLYAALIVVWYMFLYFGLVSLRNFKLHRLSLEECDFSAYLECMLYMQRKMRNPSKYWQDVNITDAYMIPGDFNAAYQNLMRLRPAREDMPDGAKMLYDYAWCRFYADQEDVENFLICKKRFDKLWQNPQKPSRRVIEQLQQLREDLSRIEAVQTGGNAQSVAADLRSDYRHGAFRSKYEFVTYCYMMGRLECNMNNLPIAKHWFAQCCSFGVTANITSKASAYVSELENMGVPYAPVPPTDNAFRPVYARFNTAGLVIPMLIALGLIIYVIMM